MKSPLVEILADFHVDDIKKSIVRRPIGTASTIRGVRTIVKKHPGVIRIVLKGTADVLDRANGFSITWSQDIDLITRYVPILYEIVKV